jgi:hypothetical protein
MKPLGTVLGAPDLVVLTLTEFAEQLRRIARGSDLPMMVDADHGYGNALNVMRTVEELEASGVSALMIEDTVLPAPFGGKDEGAETRRLRPPPTRLLAVTLSTRIQMPTDPRFPKRCRRELRGTWRTRSCPGPGRPESRADWCTS